MTEVDVLLRLGGQCSFRIKRDMQCFAVRADRGAGLEPQVFALDIEFLFLVVVRGDNTAGRVQADLAARVDGIDLHIAVGTVLRQVNIALRPGGQCAAGAEIERQRCRADAAVGGFQDDVVAGNDMAAAG